MSSTDQIQRPYPPHSASRLCADRISPVGINSFSRYSLYMPLSFFDPEIKRPWAHATSRSFLKSHNTPYQFNQESISREPSGDSLPVSKFLEEK